MIKLKLIKGLKNMSEHRSVGLGLILFEVPFSIFFFIFFALTEISPSTFRFQYEFSKMDKLEIHYIDKGLIPDMLLLFYILLISMFLILLSFSTIRLEEMWYFFKRSFLNTNLFGWFISLFLFILSINILELLLPNTSIWNVIIPLLCVFISFITLFKYANHLKKRFLTISTVIISLFVFVYSMLDYVNEDYSIGIWFLVNIIVKSILSVFKAQINLVFIWIFLWPVIIIALHGYRSAQSGKEILYRTLFLKNFMVQIPQEKIVEKDSFMKKKFTGSLMEYIIIEIFKIKDIDYFERLKLLSIVQKVNITNLFFGEKAKYIKYRNTYNFFLSIPYVINILIIVLFILPYIGWRQELIIYLLVITISRLLLRTIEIGIAFYKDVLSSEQKSSSLSGAERVKLAVISILEIMITSSVIYFLFDCLQCTTWLTEQFQKGYVVYYIEILSSFLQSFLGSIAIAFFNISYPLEEFSFKSPIHLIQVLNSVILITLSIANYLNMKKDIQLYTLSKEGEKLAIHYNIVSSSGEFFSRLILSSSNKEQLLQAIKTKWEAQEIDDQQLSNLLTCVNASNESIISEIEEFKSMNMQQIDQYVRNALIKGDVK